MLPPDISRQKCWSSAAAAVICTILLCATQPSAARQQDGPRRLIRALAHQQHQHPNADVSVTMLPQETTAAAAAGHAQLVAPDSRTETQRQQQHQEYEQRSITMLPPVGTATAAAAHAAANGDTLGLHSQQQQSSSSRRRRLLQAAGPSQVCAFGQGCCGSGPAPRGVKDTAGTNFVTTVFKRPPKSTRDSSIRLQPVVAGGDNNNVSNSIVSQFDDVSAQWSNSTSDNSSLVDDGSNLDGASNFDDSSIGSDNSSASSNSSSQTIVTPAAICSNDAEFASAAPSRTTCRFFANFWEAGAKVTYMCTAWFVSQTHMVTAGHCVSDGDGSYGLDKSDPGYVCCNFVYDARQDRMICNPAWQWNVVKWITTAGYYRQMSSANDGAVIEVVPADPESTNRPAPQALWSYYSTNSGKWRPSTVPVQQIYLDGYPGANPQEYGCSDLNTTTRYQTQQSKAAPMDGSGTEGGVIYYEVSGCQGMSGGRVLRTNERGQAFGIQTSGDPWCSAQKRGMTEVTQIVRSSNTNCGVCVPCLISALSTRPR